jgi:tetratricopeptide (TPR) repeat protein
MNLNQNKTTTGNDIVQRGIDALKKRNYEDAERLFFIYYKNNPDSVNAPLYLANTFAYNKDYDKAIAFFLQASRNDKDKNDSRISYGIAMCMIRKYEDRLINASEASESARKNIENTFIKMKVAAEKKDIKQITSVSLPRMLIYAAGGTPAGDDEVLRLVDRYLGIITSKTITLYMSKFTVKNIVSNEGIARIDLENSDKTVHDSVYLKQVNGKWLVTVYTKNMGIGEVK